MTQTTTADATREGMTPEPEAVDLDGLEALAKAATPGQWTNLDEKRGEKSSVWQTHTASEQYESDGSPSRYGPDRVYICNVVATAYRPSPGASIERLDALANAAFIAAANPATILPLIALARRTASAEAEGDRLRRAATLAVGRMEMLLEADLPESDHPVATHYVISEVKSALTGTSDHD